VRQVPPVLASRWRFDGAQSNDAFTRWRPVPYGVEGVPVDYGGRGARRYIGRVRGGCH
jgi:hypothetical protein